MHTLVREIARYTDAISIKTKEIYLNVRQQEQWNEKFSVIPLLFLIWKLLFIYMYIVYEREIVAMNQPNYINATDDRKFRIHSPIFK